jgi:transcription elongation factor GreB
VQPAEGPEKIYRIVGIDEADIERGHISWTSPLARALLDGRSGDVVKVRTPAGEQELEIVEVCYREIK